MSSKDELLKDALEKISCMTTMPDHKLNTMTLVAARKVALEALLAAESNPRLKHESGGSDAAEPSGESKHSLERGEQYPYHELPPRDFAERAALGVLWDLQDRKGIKQGFYDIDKEIRAEIVFALAGIIRAATALSGKEPQ